MSLKDDSTKCAALSWQTKLCTFCQVTGSLQLSLNFFDLTQIYSFSCKPGPVNHGCNIPRNKKTKHLWQFHSIFMGENYISMQWTQEWQVCRYCHQTHCLKDMCRIELALSTALKSIFSCSECVHITNSGGLDMYVEACKSIFHLH